MLTISPEKLQNKLKKIVLIKTILARVQHKIRRIRGSRESSFNSSLSRPMNRKSSLILFQHKSKQRRSARKRKRRKKRLQKKLRITQTRHNQVLNLKKH